jgi:1-acyl-sn-glycerol-3-phosphate acyltransferase
MGFYYKIESQVLEPDKSYMIVANHTSMTDIMLMLATVKSPLFCWKSRIKQDNYLFFFYKRTCILVDRGCSKSRLKVLMRLRKG